MFRDWLLNEERNNFKKKLIDQYEKIKVFLVDGEAVRDSSIAAQEFGGSATHASLPKVVPKNEIWIENSVDESERKVMIASCLWGLKAIERGMSADKAYKESVKKEKDYRESQHLSKKNPSKTDKPAPDKIYVKKYGEMDENVEVWLVDGKEVRDHFRVQWIEGGHGYIYSWNPNQEIWLEDGINEGELPRILLHEFVERTIMKYKKMKYDEAHKIAAKIEFKHRSKSFSKEDALALTKEKVLEMV